MSVPDRGEIERQVRESRTVVGALTRLGASVEGRYDATKIMRVAAASFGFDVFLICGVPPTEPGARLSDLIRLTTWPREVVEAFDDGHMLDVSILSAKLRESALPVWWDVRGDRERQSGQPDAHSRLFEEHGLPCHFACSASDVDGRRYVVSFSGDRVAPTSGEMAELSTIAAHMVEHLRLVDRAEAPKSPKLTPRQAEALGWVARGKTSAETAIIMDIAPATVDTYLETVLERLNAVTRAQAVAQAIRAGLID